MSEVLALSPNRWVGSLKDPRYYVAHTTEGTSSLGWLRNPASQVSATWLVPRDGPDWWRLGADDDAMWHAGFTFEPSTPLWGGGNPNLEGPGFELEGFAREPITDFQLRWWADQYRRRPMPLVGHFELATGGPYYRSDPGAENFVRLKAAMGGLMLTAEDVKNLIREMLRSDEGAILVEEAIRHPILADGRGGYGAKLQRWLDANVVYKTARALKRGTPIENPFTPVPRAARPPDGRGPRETWPEEHRAEGGKR